MQKKGVCTRFFPLFALCMWQKKALTASLYGQGLSFFPKRKRFFAFIHFKNLYSLTFFLFKYQYTGNPVNTIPIDKKHRFGSLIIALPITNNDPKIAITGTIGYKGTLYSRFCPALRFLKMNTPINVIT